MSTPVLLIEDNADLAELIEIILMGQGCAVEITSSGLTGLLRFAEAPFDLVFLDMQVEDLSGPGAHRAIKDICPGAVIVWMSAQATSWRQEALAQGATACLPKPFHAEGLVTMLKAIRSGEHQPSSPRGEVRELAPCDLEQLAALSLAEIDALPFGAFQLDKQGRITAFTDYEASSAERAPRLVVGMPFTDLAPSAMMADLMTSLEEGLRSRHLDRVLRFALPRRRASPVVAVRLYYDAFFEQTWLFVSPVRG